MNSSTRKNRSQLSQKVVALALAMALLLEVATIRAQSVYGVATRRTVVTNGSTKGVRRTPVVGGPYLALPRGYIGVLPPGYRIVLVSGARYYVAVESITVRSFIRVALFTTGLISSEAYRGLGLVFHSCLIKSDAAPMLDILSARTSGSKNTRRSQLASG